MALRTSVKDAAIASGVYGMLRRNVRRYFRPHERERFEREVEFYSSIISPGDLVFDVGANIGAKSEVFLALGARVVAFEPQPRCMRELRSRCGASDRLTTVQSAVGAAPGTAKLFLSNHSGEASLVGSWKAGEQVGEIEVPVTTLDAAIATYGVPAFCKIDVEGFELEVLSGLSRSIAMFSLEYHLSDEDVAKTLACVEQIGRFGVMSFNISFAEDAGFVWDEWVPLEAFRTLFPSRVPRTELFQYGDLFVRVAPASRG